MYSLKWNIDLIQLKDKKDQTPYQLCLKLISIKNQEQDLKKIQQLEEIKNYLTDFKK